MQWTHQWRLDCVGVVPLILRRSSKRNLLTQRHTRSHELFAEARPRGIPGSIHWSINKPPADVKILEWMLARMDARVVNNLKGL